MTKLEELKAALDAAEGVRKAAWDAAEGVRGCTWPSALAGLAVARATREADDARAAYFAELKKENSND